MTENFDTDTGKKIIEALQQQPQEEEDTTFFETEETIEEPQFEEEDYSMLDETLFEEEEQEDVAPSETPVFKTVEEPITENFYDDEPQEETPSPFEGFKTEETAPHAVVEKLAEELYQFEVPSNVAVLKKLISQLPSGVTRQTGAHIIKQTMEALGISMKSVLQDAQQVQEKLNNSAKECQATIQEYKRQIATLEEQATSYKKQYNNLNDLVSLFIQHQ